MSFYLYGLVSQFVWWCYARYGKSLSNNGWCYFSTFEVDVFTLWLEIDSKFFFLEDYIFTSEVHTFVDIMEMLMILALSLICCGLIANCNFVAYELQSYHAHDFGFSSCVAWRPPHFMDKFYLIF